MNSRYYLTFNRSSRRKRGMVSNPLFIIPDLFCIFQTNVAMATLGLKEISGIMKSGLDTMPLFLLGDLLKALLFLYCLKIILNWHTCKKIGLVKQRCIRYFNFYFHSSRSEFCSEKSLTKFMIPTNLLMT